MTDRRPGAIASLAAGLLTVATATPVLASGWAETLAAGSKAEARAITLPAGPGVVGTACTSPTASIITVTWSPVPLATGYTVFDSTTSSIGPYTSVATGLTGTSWSSGKLASGNYWFKLSASIGPNWTGGLSSPSGESTVVKNKACAQP